MKPDVTIREDSFLYRLYSFFYGTKKSKPKPPNDTCEYGKKLLTIVLLWIPYLIFVGAAVIAGLVMLVIGISNCSSCSSPLSAGDVGAGVLGVLVVGGALAVVMLIAYLIGKLCVKFAIVRRVLTEIGEWVFATLLVVSMVLVVSGQSVFSLGLVECGLFFSVISIFGALAWIILAVLGIIWGCARIFDSETYKKLKASAKEKWCAKITVVDKDGNEVGVEKKTSDESVSEEE